MDSSAPDSLHALLAKTFAELGAIGPVVRSLLLRDRFYAGQKFRCEGVQAVLLAGGNEITFYDEGGTLLKTVILEETGKKIAA